MTQSSRSPYAAHAAAINLFTHDYQLGRAMSPFARNSYIYFFIAVCAFVLASRLVTVFLILMYAPEDAEPFFFLKQAVLSAICVGLILWLWSRRNRLPANENSDG